MGVEDVVAESELGELDDSTTIGELRSIFGNEAVNRGVNYMSSLSEAEEKYRDSAKKNPYKEGMERMAGEEGTESEKLDSASEKWKSEMESGSLGIDD